MAPGGRRAAVLGLRGACSWSRRGPGCGLSWGHSTDVGVFGGGGWPSGSQGNESVVEGLGRLLAWAGAVLFPPSFLQLRPLPLPRPALRSGLGLECCAAVRSGSSFAGRPGVLQYLGRPPSHLCSGFFSELGAFLPRSLRAFPRDVAHMRATRSRPPSAPRMPGGLRPCRGHVCSGVWTACVCTRWATRLGSSLPHHRQPRRGQGRGPAGVSVGLEGTAGAKATPGQRRPPAPAPAAVSRFSLSFQELQLTCRVVSSCRVDSIVT